MFTRTATTPSASGIPKPPPQDLANPAVRQPTAARIQEQGLAEQPRTRARLQIGEYRGARLTWHRDHALPVALSPNPQLRPIAIEIPNVESRELSDSKPGAVEQVKERAVSPLELRATGRTFGFDQLLAVLCTEGGGQALLGLRSG